MGISLFLMRPSPHCTLLSGIAASILCYAFVNQLSILVRLTPSRYYMAYLHILGYLGVFDDFELHFGLKGHSHDDIDPFFSRHVNTLAVAEHCRRGGILRYTG